MRAKLGRSNNVTGRQGQVCSCDRRRKRIDEAGCTSTTVAFAVRQRGTKTRRRGCPSPLFLFCHPEEESRMDSDARIDFISAFHIAATGTAEMHNPENERTPSRFSEAGKSLPNQTQPATIRWSDGSQRGFSVFRKGFRLLFETRLKIFLKFLNNLYICKWMNRLQESERFHIMCIKRIFPLFLYTF